MQCQVRKVLGRYEIKITEPGDNYGVMIGEVADDKLAYKVARKLRTKKLTIKEARKIISEED